MAIATSNIKLLESERMADTTDGGGRKTSRVIPDGVAGNIFPKVSRLDAVYGRVNLRKIYCAVQTTDVDTYAGAHVVITDAPDNDRIHTTLFSTGSEFDTRTGARDRIESYVTRSSESRMILIGRQLTGQRAIRGYQRIEEPLPEIGNVYCLSDEVGATTNYQQYVRVADVSHELRTYTDDKGDFTYRVVTLNIGSALRYDFTGAESPGRLSNVPHQSKVRDTTVVDAARYFGIKKLTVGAEEDTVELNVESVYSNIVPTTNRETPVANVEMTGASNPVAGSAAPITTALAYPAFGEPWYLTRGALPGSVTVSWSGGSVTDNQLGTFTSAGFSATIDYDSGVITRTGGGASGLTASFIPAAATLQPAHTAATPVTIGNRGLSYTHTCNPLPAPGTYIGDFRALGKWYRLRDAGDGTIKGADPAFGNGSIDYTTGSVVLTLGALPDVDSSVLHLWGSPAHYEPRTNDASSALRHEIQLTDFPVDAASLHIAYSTQGAAKTANCTAAGVISGTHLTGVLDASTGLVVIEFTYPPTLNTPINITYDQLTAAGVENLGSQMSGNNTGSFTFGAFVPGTLQLKLFGSYPAANGFSSLPSRRNLTDTGTGFLMLDAGSWSDGGVVGTINYTTGEVVITSPIIYLETSSHFVPGMGWVSGQAVVSLGASGTYHAYYTAANENVISTPKAQSIAFSDVALSFDLTKTSNMKIVPGTVKFTCTGKNYVDINGTLYTDISPATGAGIAAGSIDYASGLATLDYFNSSAAVALSVQSCAVTYGRYTTNSVSFRTPGSPIRPASLTIQVTAEDGELLTSTTDQTGNFIGGQAEGKIQVDMGVVRGRWGEWLPTAGNELQDWYKPENVVGANVWKPRAVFPDTLRYSCIVLANLPLNADILGIDPVRLPMDGRVPIYRPGDVVVVHNTAQTALPNPAVASTTYNTGRADLADLWLVDQNGLKVPSNQYSVSLSAGTVHMAGVLTLGGYVQPLIAKHRIEELALLSDVQINGQLTLSAPLSRAYDASTLVSSAVLFGDMNAHVTNVFDLQAFSTWSDVPTTGATAQYNTIDYPIEVLNDGAVGERWRLNFLTATTYQVIGENLGVIATGSTLADCAPSNVLTGTNYFVLRFGGFGAGWSAGNQLRFNTVGASAPIWIARTILPGAALGVDSFSLQMRGDVDAA